MAKEISEMLFSKHFDKKSDNPASDMESFMERASRHGQIRIFHEKNFHSIGNPRKERTFELTKSTDGITSLIFNCHVAASGKSLSLSLSGKILSAPGDNEVFRNFYMEHVYPKSLEHMKKAAKKFSEDIETEMKN